MAYGDSVDVSGWDEIEGDVLLGDVLLGDDDEAEIMGAIAKANPNLQKALAARRAAKGTLVKQMQPRKGRRLPLGLDSGAVLIAAGAQVNVIVTPQKPFRVESLIVDPTSAPSFQVLNVAVGTDSQFVTAAPIIASVFVPNSMNVGLKGDTCQMGMSITVSVLNVSLAAARFWGALVGTAVGY